MAMAIETLAIEATRQGMRFVFVVLAQENFLGLFSFSLLLKNLHFGVT